MSTPSFSMQDAPSFSVWVLEWLRTGKFRPAAWMAMFAESWAQSRLTARAHPRLTRSWRMLAGGLAGASTLALKWTARRHGVHAARRSAFPLALMTAAQATDIYAHLGLHRRENARPYQHYPHLGAANALTSVRGWVASWCWSRLLAGVPLDDAELALAFALVFATDLADGPIARTTRHASPLGRYLDGEADLFAWSALTLTQIRRGQIPPWFLAVFAMRWGLPLALGLGRTFAQADPISLEHSSAGRVAGVAQAALSLAGLAASWREAKRDAQTWRTLRDGLAATSSGLMLAAMVVHLRKLSLKR